MQQRAIDTKNRILESASELFSRRGFNGVTVDDIATACNANKQRIYAYYGSKKKLFEAVLLNEFREVTLLSKNTLENARKNPDKMTSIVLRGFFNVHKTHPRFWRLLAWANLEESIDANSLRLARKEENEQLAKIYHDAVANGHARPMTFENYLFTLLALSYFHSSNRRSLEQTLGLDMTEKNWTERLIEELDNVFSAEK